MQDLPDPGELGRTIPGNFGYSSVQLWLKPFSQDGLHVFVASLIHEKVEV